MEEINKEEFFAYIPDQYRDKMFLTVSDIKETMQLGQTLTYEWLNGEDLPFKIIRINSKILINAYSFWCWYFTKD